MIARIFATPLSEFKPFIIMHHIGGAVIGSQEVYYSIDTMASASTGSVNSYMQVYCLYLTDDRQALLLAAL